jgi:outer membrane protein assembly factor BamD (BamD/ComL family)
MRPNRYIVFALFSFSFSLIASSSFAQLGFSFDLKKPQQYEERVLRSEKSESKKFTAPQKFIQNTTTHYNYFFNANNKLNEIITRAKDRHKDDLSGLLSFYNYELEVTQRDSLELDSVIFKSTTGIVLHDLRSDWADNMYLLWGAAYYLKKEFDSAFLTFQFINYAFAPKEKDGYYRYIGSRMDDNSPMSISTNEKRSLPKKLFSLPPSRNDAFIWQIRTFLAQDAFPEAASIIATLKADPVFPKRLQKDLEEVQAWYFYKQNMWDSSAAHLSKALDNATNKQEKARWEFLTAQMYELSHNYAQAQQYYEKAIGHTVDPVMAVYARLYATRINQTGGDNFIEKNIAELVKMAKRDRYSDYRDIIYYMAAQMELERNNIGGAQQLLIKATEYNGGNISQRNKAYLKLADLAFANKDYLQAKNFYDSLNLSDPDLKDVATIRQRKDMLDDFAEQTVILMRQDSLQRIAAMPEEARKDFVKKILKDLRKQQGYKDDGTKSGGFPITITPDLFNTTQTTKGEWYFYNAAVRTKGAADFAAKWGNRPNVDNWRRLSAVANQTRQNGKLLSNQPNAKLGKDSTTNQPDELSFDALYAKLPITEDKLKLSNDSIQQALFELGKIYGDELEDCSAMINTYEQLRNKFPEFSRMDEVLFHLYYCYNKNGDAVKASQIKSLMTSKYPNSNFTKTTTSGISAATEATKTYEKIYDLFVEGKFDEALAQKKAADSLYGQNYWTPQLLYIESVYYIKQRNDTSAISSLRTIITKYPNSPLAAKATTMIDVLGRRTQIEEELTNMQVQRIQDQPARTVDTTTTRPVIKTDSVVKKMEQPKIDNKVNQPITDTVSKKPITVPFVFNPNSTYSVMIILNKMDGIFASETKNSFDTYNRRAFPRPFTYESVILSGETRLLLIKAFSNAQAAMDYVQRVKTVTPTQILSWLKPDKYHFSIISDANLELLRTSPDIEAYKRFMEQNLPGKF